MSEELGLIIDVDNRLGPVTINAFGEKFFFNLNRNSFDKVSAQILFETKFGKTLFNEDSLYIIIGTDSGLLPRFIQNKPLPKGSRYIFLEPDPVLQVLLSSRMLDDLDDQRILCIGLDDWAETIQKFKITDYFYINAVRSINAICAQDDYIQEYAELSWHITEVLSQMHWMNSVQLGTEAFISRQIINVTDNKLPAKLLEQAFANKTVVLLAGGPSLDDVLSWVKLHRNSIVVFAVSRISRQLQQSEIIPDFVFSVDPTELSFDISKEMLDFDKRTIFIYSYHTVPTLVNQWGGLAFYLGSRLPWKSDLNEINFDGVGPTVTNTALNIAHRFGFKRIILAGVDLCFTREGFTHAKGSDEHLAGPRFNLTSLQVETNGGFMAPTSCDFAQAATSLAAQAKFISNSGCQIINFSANAAKVDGIEYLPLFDISIEPESIDVMAVVAAKLLNNTQKKQYYSKIGEELRRGRFQINAINQLAKSARQINDNMYGSQDTIVNYKDKKKLDQIEKKFKREYRGFARLVKRFGIRRFMQMVKPFNDEEWSAEEVRSLGNVFYDAYQEGASKLLSLLDEALERLQAREQEELSEPNMSLLIAQCNKDRSFGRVRMWKKKFHVQAGSAEIQEALDDFERQYVDILSNQNTKHFARAKSHSNLVTVKHRAGLLFKHKKIEELRDLLVAVDKHDEVVAAKPYRHLIAGYLSELSSDWDAALAEYQQVIDNGDVLVEEALTRVAGVGVEQGDVDVANLSLQCLSQLNPVYLPLYAEMRRLHGDVMGAIDAYGLYINDFPEDASVQMKLAMLYIENQIYDAAEIMVDYILQKNAGLEAASVLKRQLLAVSRSAENG